MERLNFSWVIPYRLAGCAGPRVHEDLLYLKRKGITLLVRLIEEDEIKVSSQQVAEAGLMDLHVSVGDFHALSQTHIDAVINHVRKTLEGGGRVAVSCRAGIGRTGTMLSCILISQGYTVEEAFGKVKQTRRQNEAYESFDQYNAIITFAKRIGRE